MTAAVGVKEEASGVVKIDGGIRYPPGTGKI